MPLFRNEIDHNGCPVPPQNTQPGQAGMDARAIDNPPVHRVSLCSLSPVPVTESELITKYRQLHESLPA